MMRPKSKLKEFAEIALMYSIPEMTTKRPTKSRLGSLYDQLQKVTAKALNTSHFVATQEERAWLEKVIQKFGKDTGWESTPKHIGTVASFCTALAERGKSLNPGILEKLNLIIEHLEAGGDLKVQSCWAGSLAMEKWDAIFMDAPYPSL
jgi:hypothetical protein